MNASSPEYPPASLHSGMDDQGGLFEAMFRNHLAVMFLLDPESLCVLDANHAALAFYGWDSARFGSLSLHQICLDGDGCTDITRETCRREGGRVSICKHRMGDGGERVVDMRTSRIRVGERSVLFAIVTDITARIEAEEALRESEARFRSITENVMEGIFLATPEGRFLWLNPTFAKMLGYADPGEVTGMITDYCRDVRPDGAAPDCVLAEIAASGERREVRFVRTDGCSIWVSLHVWALRGEDGQVLRYEGVAKDITARHQSESERMLLVAAVEQTVEGVVIVGADWKVEYVNPSVGRILGLERASMLGGCFFNLLDRVHPPLPKEDIRATLRAGREWSGVMGQTRPGGGGFKAEATLSPIRFPTGEVAKAVVLLRDVSYQDRLEKRLRRAQKLEAVGTLAGGIAHDFNNILTPILLNAEVGMQLLEPGDILRKPLEDIIRAGGRARQLVKQILAFSRRGEFRAARMELAPVVRETLDMLRPALPAGVEMAYSECREPLVVMADPSMVHQMVSNLVDNALYAMRERGGMLSVSIKRLDTRHDHSLSLAPLSPGEYAELSVRDTGHGMDVSLLDRIFTPFFTTKGPGEGTGMGLSTVHGIVRSLGGTVRVESELGHGSLFRVYLPLASGAEPPAEATEEAREEGGRTKGRALVVDAQAFSRQALAMSLRELGYKVTVMRDARKALAVFRSVSGRFGSVFAGEDLHGMSGWEFLSLCREIRASATLVLLADQVVEGLGSVVADAVLAKPAGKAALARALDAAPGAQPS